MIDGFQMLPLMELNAFTCMVRNLEQLVKVEDKPQIVSLSNRTKIKIDIFNKTRGTVRSNGIGSPEGPRCINEKNKDVVGLFEGRIPSLPLYKRTRTSENSDNVSMQQQRTTIPTPSGQQQDTTTGRASTVTTCSQKKQDTPKDNWRTQGKRIGATSSSKVSQNDRRGDVAQQTSSRQSDNGTASGHLRDDSVIGRGQGIDHREMRDGRRDVRMNPSDTNGPRDCQQKNIAHGMSERDVRPTRMVGQYEQYRPANQRLHPLCWNQSAIDQRQIALFENTYGVFHNTNNNFLYNSRHITVAYAHIPSSPSMTQMPLGPISTRGARAHAIQRF